MDKFDEKIKPSLLEEHADMNEKDVDTFRRKWEYYFAYCEAGFVTKTLGDIILTIAREGSVQMMEDVPI
jgi:cyclopropane-fatty-acyl-phospholipid synthase